MKCYIFDNETGAYVYCNAWTEDYCDCVICNKR